MVPLEEADPKNCWEYWNCSEEVKMICPVHEKGAGSMCWNFVGGSVPFVERKFDLCGDCPWFKKRAPEIYKNK